MLRTIRYSLFTIRYSGRKSAGNKASRRSVIFSLPSGRISDLQVRRFVLIPGYLRAAPPIRLDPASASFGVFDDRSRFVSGEFYLNKLQPNCITFRRAGVNKRRPPSVDLSAVIVRVRFDRVFVIAVRNGHHLPALQRNPYLPASIPCRPRGRRTAHRS